MSFDEYINGEEVRTLIDDYRAMCLWYLDDDFLPQNYEELLGILDKVERYGDLAAYRRVARIREWLSRISRVAS